MASETKLYVIADWVDDKPRYREADFRAAGYVPAAELQAANERAERAETALERVNKHRALEQHALRRRLANQKTELKNLGKAYSGAWRFTHRYHDQLKAREAELEAAERILLQVPAWSPLQLDINAWLLSRPLRSAAKPAQQEDTK